MALASPTWGRLPDATTRRWLAEGAPAPPFSRFGSPLQQKPRPHPEKAGFVLEMIGGRTFGSTRVRAHVRGIVPVQMGSLRDKPPRPSPPEGPTPQPERDSLPAGSASFPAGMALPAPRVGLARALLRSTSDSGLSCRPASHGHTPTWSSGLRVRVWPKRARSERRYQARVMHMGVTQPVS